MKIIKLAGDGDKYPPMLHLDDEHTKRMGDEMRETEPGDLVEFHGHGNVHRVE